MKYKRKNLKNPKNTPLTISASKGRNANFVTKAQQTLKAPGVMKEMLLWSRDRDLRDGRVPKALSDRNLSLFFSRLMAEASQGNSFGSSAKPARSHSTLQLLSCVQEQDAGQARTHAQRASTVWGSRHSTETGSRTEHRSKSTAAICIWWHNVIRCGAAER